MAHSRMADRTPQDQEKYIVRFPDGMRDRIKSEADRNGRSMNAEIVTRLEASLIGVTNGNAIDQVFENVVSAVAGKHGAERHVQMLLAYYDDYKRDQIHKLREFLDLVSDTYAAIDGRATPNIHESAQRSMENEFNRLQSWANAWGYDVVKKNRIPENE